MAKQLDKTKVAMGNLIAVENQNQKPGESASYYAVKLEDRNDSEFWCLFTEKEVQSLKYCELDDGQNRKKGRLYYRNKVGKTWRSFVTLLFQGGNECTVTLTDSLIKRGKDRAQRNAEDIPSMSWLKDVLD